MKFTEFLKENIVSKVYEQNADEDPQGEDPWYNEGQGEGEGDPIEEPFVPEPIAPPAPAPKKKKGTKGKEEEEKPEKEVKSFNVGDVIVLSDTKKSNKIPADAWDFLMTYKTFTVKKVNDKGKMDLGCHISKNEPANTDGVPFGVEKIYMFSPNRFDLKDGVKSGIKPLDLPEDDD